MAYRDEDLVLPFRAAMACDPYQLPFRVERKAKEVPLPPERLDFLSAFFRYKHVGSLDALYTCMCEEIGFEAQKKALGNVDASVLRQATLQWLKIGGVTGRVRSAFERAKLVEFMKELISARDVSPDEVLGFFPEAGALTINLPLNAEKILSVLKLLEKDNYTDCYWKQLFENPETTEEQRQVILQEIHNKHAEIWNFRSASVTICDLNAYYNDGYDHNDDGCAVRGGKTNSIFLGQGLSRSFPKSVSTVFHEGVHIYQFDLMDALDAIINMWPYASFENFVEHESDFLNHLRGLFPYRPGDLFREMIHHDNLFDYALICFLGGGEFYDPPSSSDEDEEKNFNYVMNPRESLAWAVGQPVLSYLNAPDGQSRQSVCAEFQEFVDLNGEVAAGRRILYAQLFRGMMLQPE